MARLLPLLVLALCIPLGTEAQDVVLRPIDEATVRIVGAAGVTASRGVVGGTARTIFEQRSSHGSGVMLDDRHIATAAHVVEGLDVLFVRFAQEDVLHPGVVVAKDPDHDVAIVRVEPRTRPSVPIPRVLPTLTPGETLNITGYPLDVRQQTPAAASGALSRRNNEGWLEISASLNPGNSGGPVVNAAGELVGIVSARGRVDRGIQGIAFAAPVRYVRELFGHASARIPFQLPGNMSWLFDESASPTASQLITPELAALAAHHQWRAIVTLLSEEQAANRAALTRYSAERAREMVALIEAALPIAEQSTRIATRYELAALRRELSAFQAAPASAPGPVPVQNVGPAPAPYNYGAAPAPRPRRLVLQVGPEFGGPGISIGLRASMSYDVYYSQYFQVFVGGQVLFGYWTDGCDCEDVSFLNDTTYYGFGIEAGPRLRLGAFALEAAFHLGYFNAYDTGFFDARSIRVLAALQWRVFGVGLMYRYRYLGGVDNSSSTLRHHGIGPVFMFRF